MAAQSSLREELKVLRRKEWERRNQEVLQDKELYQETTPLFGEPFKTNKGDELSSRIQRMLGNYEDGNSLPYGQYDVLSRDPPPSSSHGSMGPSVHKGKGDPSFQVLSPLGGSKQVQSRDHSSQNLKKYPILDTSSTDSKDDPVKSHPRKSDSWSDARVNPRVPSALPGLSPLERPLSPLHSSDSSDSEQDTARNNDDRSLSPVGSRSSGKVELTRLSGTQTQETSEDTPLMVPQTFPPPLSSKLSLANSKKPMALVRPMDGPDQIVSESPELKPSPDDFLRQSYENLSDLKSSNKPSLPPLKMPSQPVEVLSNDVQRVDEILKEMTHSWPPLLTAIQTPSTAEPSKFSFPNKEPHVHSGYQQPQKQHESSPKAPVLSEPVVRDDAAATLAPPSGGESASSSDSESSSESESDSESSESGTEETPPASSNNTPPAKVEGLKDISWQLTSWIKESQQSLNPQNQVEVSNTKSATSTKPQTEEDSRRRSKKHDNSHIVPAQPKFSDAHADEKPAPLNQHADLKPVAKTSTSVENRKTMGDKHTSKSSKPQSSLLVESVEVTPRNKDATFTERLKVKTKSSHDTKSEGRKASKHVSIKKEEKDRTAKAAPTTVDRKEVETESVHAKSNPNTNTAPTKNSKKSQAHLPKTERKSEKVPKANGDQSLALVVKIKLSQLTRIPKVTKPGTITHSEGPLKEEKQISRVSKKRHAEHAEQPVPNKKLKLEKDGKSSSSSQHHSSGKTESKKRSQEDKEKDRERKSSKKDQPTHPPQSTGHKKRSGDMEMSSHSSSKHKKKSSSKEETSKNEKKAVKISATGPELNASTTAPSIKRPLLKVDNKIYSVEHHMMEAKKLKHKADAMGDKMSKALSYLDAAMSFVESGIAMETDPQTPKSAYTMFSDTVDLIRFILKLKNYLDPSAPPSERDFFVLCMRCKALLQMAMFRSNRESALDYCRNLTDYFKSSKTMQAPSPCIAKISSPGSPMPSPASSVASNPSSNSSSTVSIPQLIQQMASSYINITSLFLSAHETWEQAEELARTRTGLLIELDVALGRLNLTSSMTSLVRYTRQGLHWLKMDNSIPRPGPCA